MRLDINGDSVEVTDNPEAMLLWALRDELGITGTKFGCGAGICGACTVHVDGIATRACVTPLSAVADKSIRTIEGLAQNNSDGTRTLHPVQQAFIDQQVPQCGWCMSGQIMAAAAFLEQNANPTLDDINLAMSGNYCRCGCYVRIRSAVEQAAAELAAQPMNSEVAA